MLNLNIFDFLGTFAFAAFGAYLAQKKGYDIFGVCICALISALGGGTIREILLNSLPAYFHDYRYWVVVALGIIFSIIFFKNFHKINFWMLVVDAIGLVTFAYIGASRAYGANLGIFGIVIFAVVTAVGGGVLRDIVMRETPIIFYQDIYATPAFLFGIAYFLLRNYINIPWVLYLLLFSTLVLRIVVMKFNLHLWKPNTLKS